MPLEGSTLIAGKWQVLYMPGSNAKAIAKARTLPADSICIDLEDAVAPSVKEDARMQVLAAIQEGGFGAREVAVRANGLDTPWGEDDIAMIAQSGAHALCLPKVDSIETVVAAHKVLEEAGAPPTMSLWCMIETPMVRYQQPRYSYPEKCARLPTPRLISPFLVPGRVYFAQRRSAGRGETLATGV
jgi:citrate lyase subunit beta/citryl-CoA lyase